MNKEQALQKLDALEKEAQALRKIIEAPEKSPSLLELDNTPYVSMWPVRVSKDPNISEEYYKAFKTFILLRQQEGSEPAKNKMQWFIIIAVEEYEQLCVEGYYYATNRISELSPCFKSRELAQKAIDVVGKENILHMFKTFHGIYE